MESWSRFSDDSQPAWQPVCLVTLTVHPGYSSAALGEMLGAAFLLQQLSDILPTFSPSPPLPSEYTTKNITSTNIKVPLIVARLMARPFWELFLSWLCCVKHQTFEFQKETIAMECGHLDRICGKNGFQASNFPCLTDISSKLECGECGDTSSVWLCVSCGALNCGRYIKAHGLMHKVGMSAL